MNYQIGNYFMEIINFLSLIGDQFITLFVNGIEIPGWIRNPINTAWELINPGQELLPLRFNILGFVIILGISTIVIIRIYKFFKELLPGE